MVSFSFHHICNRASFARFLGLRLDPDFVEIPTQVLENWCYESISLKLVSGFYQDITKPIKDERCKALKRWQYSFSALKLKQEILYCGMYGMPPLMDRYGLGMGLAMDHADMAAKSDSNSKHKMPDGSWKCEKCNNINYPFRTKCNRQNCGADEPFEGQKSPSEPVDENDQVK